MAKQTFSVGQVLTAAQMTSLQQTAMLGGAASAKTTSYTLVAADAGTAISMTSTSATTITVNTGLFSAGDTVQITNLGTGVCTITAGTATVNTSASLALAQYESGTLDFTSASAAIFIKGAGAPPGATGKPILQIVTASTTTQVSITATSFQDSGLSATITPTLNTSNILVMIMQPAYGQRSANAFLTESQVLRNSTQIFFNTRHTRPWGPTSNNMEVGYNATFIYLDSPASTSALTYKTQYKTDGGGTTLELQLSNALSQIILMEIGA
jgi:hypothetical protein